MPFSSDRAVLAPCCDFRVIRLRQIAEDHAIGNVVADAGLLALVFERHLDGKPDCPAGTGLRDSRAGDRCLLRSDRLSPAAEDRPHFYVQTLGAAYADAPVDWPSWPGWVSVFRLTLYRWAKALYARQAGSRLPLRRRSALADQRRSTGTAKGLGNVRRRLPARCT